MGTSALADMPEKERELGHILSLSHFIYCVKLLGVHLQRGRALLLLRKNTLVVHLGVYFCTSLFGGCLYNDTPFTVTLQDFRDAVAKASQQTGKPVIEDRNLNQILYYLPQLYELNQDLLKELEERVAQWYLHNPLQVCLRNTTNSRRA